MKKCEWNFCNNFARIVVVFGVDCSLSSHTDSCKNGFLVLGKGDTFDIKGSFGAPEKWFSINFSTAKTKFCLSLHYISDNSYLFVNGRKICRFEASNKNVNCSSQFCLGSIFNKFDFVETEEVSLKENEYGWF